MEFKSPYGQDNIHYMSECPALGMPFTGTIYLRNRDLNKKIMQDNKLTSSYEYRKFLQKNAVSLMKADYEKRIDYNGVTHHCKKDPHGGIVDVNGVIGSKGIDNMPLQTTSDGREYQLYTKTTPMMETRCNDTVPSCQRVLNDSHDLDVDAH